MLRVTKILEGGLNLDKGEEIPRSMVITNGKREVIVPVPDSVVKELVELFADELKVKERTELPQTKQTMEKVLDDDEGIVSSQKVKAQPGMTGSLFESEPDAPPSLMVDETGFEPGEEYDDGGTGVSSL